MKEPFFLYVSKKLALTCTLKGGANWGVFGDSMELDVSNLSEVDSKCVCAWHLVPSIQGFIRFSFSLGDILLIYLAYFVVIA